MIVINGMLITDKLVDFLKGSYDFDDTEILDTRYDSYVNSLLELNDYLIEALTYVPLDNIAEIKSISNHLIEIKAMRDRMKQLSALLKECREEGAQS